MLRKEKGITLIALAITIIVLLILAGVSLMALSDSGIIGRAQNAASSYERASTKEDSSLDVVSEKLSSLISSINTSTVTTSD